MRPVAALTLLLTVLPAHADVTIRYKTEARPASLVPSGADGEISIHMKGNKGCSTAGPVITIVDFSTREVTWVATSLHKFAVLPAALFAEKLRSAIPQFPAGTPDVKPKVDTRKTGRTEVIQGIVAVESETTVSLELQPGIAMRVVVQLWTAKAAVLEYFALCRKFWTRGAASLDAWEKIVREGGTPDFGTQR